MICVEVLDEGDQLLEQQYGFRPDRSCTDALFSLRLLCESAYNKRKTIFLCMLDLTKAFDSEDRDMAWQILLCRGVPFDDNFSISTLATTTNKRRANEWEYYWIRHYDTQSSLGYNITKQDPTHSSRFWFLHRLGALLLCFCC